ncbi:MAG: hypothetical protein AAF614_28575 [Chloroflexota bacterium]
MRNRKVILGTIIIALLTVGLVAFMVLPSAEELLVTAGETIENATDAHAVVSVEVEMPDESMSGTVEVWGQKEAGPNGEPAFRIEVLEASKAEMVGVTAVSDGTNFWLYHPQENKVMTGTFDQLKAQMEEKRAAKEAAGESFDKEEWADKEEFAGFDGTEFDPEDMPENWEEAVAKLLEYVTAERTGSEDVGNMPAYGLRLIPKPDQMPDELRANGGFFNVWIGVESQVPIAAEYAEAAVGYAKATASVMEINQGIDPTVFTFAIPDGAEVVTVEDLEKLKEQKDKADAQANELVSEAVLLTPAELPTGARETEKFDIGSVVVQQFSLENGRSFTGAQGKPSDAFLPEGEGVEVTVRGVAGTAYEDAENGRSLVTWLEGDLQFWVGGDLTADEALFVASSLE